MRTTKIEWTYKIWNPITGCTKILAPSLGVPSRRLRAKSKAHAFHIYNFIEFKL